MLWYGTMIDGLHIFNSGFSIGLIRDAYAFYSGTIMHPAYLVDEFLESDYRGHLNPIENLWNYLEKAVARKHPTPRDAKARKIAGGEDIYSPNYDLLPKYKACYILCTALNSFPLLYVLFHTNS